MPNTIIIGANSGIGRALAVEFVRNSHTVGATERRVERLAELKNELPTKNCVKPMDIRDTQAAPKILSELIDEMNGADEIMTNSGMLSRDAGRDGIQTVIDTNVTGFVAMAEAAVNFFLDKQPGHLVEISSIAALRGARRSPVYNASKAFACTDIGGLRHRITKTNQYHKTMARHCVACQNAAGLDLSQMVMLVHPGRHKGR